MDLANGRLAPRQSRRAGAERDQKTETGRKARAAASATIERDRCSEGPNAPSVREVRLLGLDHPPRGAAWSPGREIQWLGRDYIVIATADRSRARFEEASAEEAPHYYVHLDGSSERPRRRPAEKRPSSSRLIAPVAAEARDR